MNFAEKTMNQIFGTAETAVEEEENEAEDIKQRANQTRRCRGDSVTFVPPTAHQDQEVANDNETVVENEDDEFFIETPGAKSFTFFSEQNGRPQ